HTIQSGATVLRASAGLPGFDLVDAGIDDVFVGKGSPPAADNLFITAVVHNLYHRFLLLAPVAYELLQIPSEGALGALAEVTWVNASLLSCVAEWGLSEVV
ncbi:unnamed protein product, partial [Symbiodinium sp. KB8]